VQTPEAGLPTSGSATFDGIIRGSADYLVDDGWGGVRPSDVVGTVTLSFDFQKSALSGSMEAFLCCNNDISLGIYQFRDTVYSAGKYSGRFDTGLPGLNGFYGQLTGPKAQETVGGWAVPFMIDGDLHEAMGAWVAGRPK
jgi:hypothetical protein